MFELEYAKITGCIGTERIEQLRGIPGLHARETQAIDDAYCALRLLAGEEEWYAAEEKRRGIEEALHKLRSIAPDSDAKVILHSAFPGLSPALI